MSNHCSAACTDNLNYMKNLTTKLFSAICFLISLSLVVIPLHPVLAAAFVTLESFSGPPNGVVVSGGGWTPGETVSLYLNTVAGSPVATATVGGDSFFGPINLLVPVNTPQGPLPILVTGSISGGQEGNSYYVVSYTPTITVTGNNAPGSALTIEGTGFAPSERVHFFLAGNLIGQATADATGNVTAGAAVVPSVPAAAYEIHAIGQSSGAGALDYFYVGGFYPSLTPSSYYILPTQVLMFSGGGFAPGETIQVFEGQNATPLASFSADSTGSFVDTGNVTIPASLLGTRTFRASGLTSQASAEVLVTVGTFIPNIAPSAYYILPGQVLTFSGSGFASGETVKIFAGDSQTELAEFMVDSEGTFTGSGGITIPFAWIGSSRTFHFVGQIGGGTGDITLTVGQFNSLVSPSLYHISAGEDISFSGNGFAPGETIMVTEGESSAVLARITADADGGFLGSGTFALPFAWADSSHTLHFTGVNSGTSAEVIITIAGFLVQLEPSAFYALPGESLTLSGTGFAPNENVLISMNGGTNLSVPASPTGELTAVGPFVAPFTGSMQFVATGESSQATANVAVTLGSLFASVTPDSWYVPSGSAITFSGTGFAASEPITLAHDGSVLETITADATGSFMNYGVSTTFGLDRSSTYTFTGTVSGVVAAATITIAALAPIISLDTYYTLPGTTMHVNGSGFAASEPVTITLGSATALGSTDTTGSVLAAPITIPVSMTGDALPVTMTGMLSGASATTYVTLAPFMPLITPSAWYTPVGSHLTFAGSGFAAGETVTIAMNESLAGSAMVDATGAFTSSPIAIPFGATAANFSFMGNLSNTTVLIPISLALLYPGIQLSTYYDAGGAPFTVTGMGYACNESVTLTFGGETFGTTMTDTNGSFTFTSTVPYALAGDKTVTATGESSAATASATFTEPGVYVDVQLGSYAGAPGSPITVIGSGFIPGETVAVSTDRTGTTTVHSFAVGPSGSFSDAGFTVPTGFIEGPLMLTIKGMYSHAPVSITYYVTGG